MSKSRRTNSVRLASDNALRRYDEENHLELLNHFMDILQDPKELDLAFESRATLMLGPKGKEIPTGLTSAMKEKAITKGGEFKPAPGSQLSIHDPKRAQSCVLEENYGLLTPVTQIEALILDAAIFEANYRYDINHTQECMDATLLENDHERAAALQKFKYNPTFIFSELRETHPPFFEREEEHYRPTQAFTNALQTLKSDLERRIELNLFNDLMEQFREVLPTEWQHYFDNRMTGKTADTIPPNPKDQIQQDMFALMNLIQQKRDQISRGETNCKSAFEPSILDKMADIRETCGQTKRKKSFFKSSSEAKYQSLGQAIDSFFKVYGDVTCAKTQRITNQ